MYQSGRLEQCVTKPQATERLREMSAIASNTVPHRKPLKGLKKFLQFVESPGFLM
jgi:hypothetical protein